MIGETDLAIMLNEQLGEIREIERRLRAHQPEQPVACHEGQEFGRCPAIAAPDMIDQSHSQTVLGRNIAVKRLVGNGMLTSLHQEKNMNK